MPTTITIETFASRDGYGERSFGAPTPVLCRLQEKTERVTIPSGEEVLARGRAYLAEITGVTVEDKITLPDGTTPEILAVPKVNDESGPHHEVIIFK
jgi:hypothetical protein